MDGLPVVGQVRGVQPCGRGVVVFSCGTLFVCLFCCWKRCGGEAVALSVLTSDSECLMVHHECVGGTWKCCCDEWHVEESGRGGDRR